VGPRCGFCPSSFNEAADETVAAISHKDFLDFMKGLAKTVD